MQQLVARLQHQRCPSSQSAVLPIPAPGVTPTVYTAPSRCRSLSPWPPPLRHPLQLADPGLGRINMQYRRVECAPPEPMQVRVYECVCGLGEAVPQGIRCMKRGDRRAQACTAGLLPLQALAWQGACLLQARTPTV